MINLNKLDALQFLMSRRLERKVKPLINVITHIILTNQRLLPYLTKYNCLTFGLTVLIYLDMDGRTRNYYLC